MRKSSRVLLPGDRFGNGYRFDPGIVLQGVVKAPQELASRLRVIFPRILTVENDGDHRVPAPIPESVAPLP